MNLEAIIGTDFRGCASVSLGKRIFFERAYGYADFANSLPNRPDTKFATASAGKAFVAAGIMLLVTEGRLHLDDRIGDLLNIDFHTIDRNITVRQLLTHTSGIPDYFDESIMKDYAGLWENFPNYRIRHNADLLPLFETKPMLYPKGTKFQYNNSGYVVLALILEAVTQMEFDVFLKARVFDKCGMTGTGYYELDRLPAGCANSYLFDEQHETYYTNIFSVDAKGTGAGGAYTTVGDIRNFWHSLTSGNLLPMDVVHEMFSPQNQIDGVETHDLYGYGFWLKRMPNGAIYPYFQGSDPGVSFVSVCRPEDCAVTTLVSNYGDNVWHISDTLWQTPSELFRRSDGFHFRTRASAEEKTDIVFKTFFTNKTIWLPILVLTINIVFSASTNWQCFFSHPSTGALGPASLTACTLAAVWIVSAFLYRDSRIWLTISGLAAMMTIITMCISYLTTGFDTLRMESLVMFTLLLYIIFLMPYSSIFMLPHGDVIMIAYSIVWFFLILLLLIRHKKRYSGTL